MGMRNIAFMQSALQNIKKNSDDYRALQAAKVKQKQEREKFDMDMKIKKLEIDKAEQIGELDKFEADMWKEYHKNLVSEGKGRLGKDDNQIEMGLVGTKNKLKTDVDRYKNLASDEMEERRIGASIPGYEVEMSRQRGQLPKSTIKKSTKPTFDETLQKVELGEMTYEDVRKKYPSKAGAIQKARVSGLPPRSQSVIKQMQDRLKEASENNKFEEESADIIKQLNERREEAAQKGIDIDEILNILGISEDDINLKKPRNVWGKLKDFMNSDF